ncbi:MAG: Dam family site-specific DNA-(adenine-N6)-methyltransferase [Clostridia bacterium]|nr:Dam family site-specific DNA-(adenine-N6)-methyltransferase [Clostridia bacterium]
MFIKSPMNYIGGKYSLLKEILPLFPKPINTFVDLFAGGLNVGINVEAKRIIVNDQINYLIDLYQYLNENETDKIIEEIENIINQYQLSMTNVEGYNQLREDYNSNLSAEKLFVLTCYAFNHQIRFNNSQKFNTPFGKERSSYNHKIKENLIRFCDKLHDNNFEFSNRDFNEFDFSRLQKNDFVYCDPPYLISNGSYNDGRRGFKNWTLTEERQLQKILDELNDKGIQFALSNVFYHKGNENIELIEWSKKYKIHYFNKTYKNCSYHLKDREAKTVEVLITNYE